MVLPDLGQKEPFRLHAGGLGLGFRVLNVARSLGLRV